MNHALPREVKQYLLLELEGGGGIPQWVVERVHKFSAGWYLFVEASAFTVAPLVPWDIEEVPGRVQEFYRVLEDDLRVLGGLKEGNVVGNGVVDGEKDEVQATVFCSLHLTLSKEKKSMKLKRLSHIGNERKITDTS